MPTHLPSADNNITEHGSGLERYNIMARAFNPIAPFTSKAEMWNLMDQLKYTNTYTGLTGSDPWGSEFVGIDDITVDTPIADIQASAGVQAAIDKFNNRSRDPEDPNYGTWHTMHSCVYDVVNTSISVASQEGSEEYTYELPKTSEEDNEIRLSEISDETIDTSQNATLQLILDGIFNENKTFIINYNDEEKILTNSTPMRDDHGVYLPFSGSPHGDYTLLRVYYDVPTKLVMGCKRYQMLPVMYSLMDIAEGSPLATNCLVAVCDDFRKITYSAPNPFKIGLKDGWKGDGTVQYSFNKQDWFDWDGVTPIVAEQNVYDVYEVHFRGVDNTYLWQDDENYTAFCVDSTMNDVRVKGNVVYMLDYETDVPDTLDHIFQGLFSGGGIEEGTESGLYDATDLTLPFTSLGDYSYKYMFENCVNLINGPQIPAIEAKVESCMGMFKGCKSLEECPTLPATVLGNRCYAEMFMGCETIVEAPTLAAQILKEECYKDMFNGCIALEECPALPAVMFAIPKGAYKGMFQGCVAITAMPALEATMLEESAYESMFNGCTALVDTPNKLPAMAMAKYCYKNMFTNCDSLVKMPQLPAKTMQPYCYQEMFSECDNLEKLSELPIDMTAEGCCQQMFLNCPKITKPLDLPAKVLAKYCYRGMFQNCSGICWFASGKVYKVPSIGKATSSQVSAGWNIDMFRGTTVYCEEEEAPIPITVNNYYYSVPDEYLVLSSFTGKTTTDLKNTLPAGDKTGNLICSVDGGETWKPFVGGDTVTSSYTSPEHPTCSIYLCGRITEVKETYGLQSTDLLEVSGDIKCMSSISPEIWEVSQPDVNYAGLFNEMENLYEAKDLILVPEYTSDYMYQNLFRNTYILHGPIIPETTNVAAHAYEGMFESCKYLEETPVMTFPEVDIHEYGYAKMFFNCLRLPMVPADVFPGIIAPEYSAHAYEQMFYGCTKIKYSANFTDDFRTAPYCCSGMYQESGVETIADNIWNVDVIEAHAYEYMYSETKIAVFPTDIALDIVKDYGCQYMFSRNKLWTCESVEDSIELTPQSLGKFSLTGMFHSNSKIKACPIVLSKDVETIPEYCCAYMYRNCESLKYLPKLYATKLGSWCYSSMFDGCPNIIWSRFGSPWRVPWKVNATQVGTNVVTDMFKGTTAYSPDDYGIPGSETTPPVPGTPQIFTNYYYGDPSEWVTFTSDKTFTASLTPQYVYFNEETQNWEYSSTTRNATSYLVDGTYVLKVAGFHTTVSTKKGEERNDNPITMTGEGWVKAKGKIAALIGHGLTNGSHIFMGNTILRDITELDLETPLTEDDFNASPTGFRLECLFQGCTGLVDEGVPSVFPLTVLAPYNCQYMFRGCTGLTKGFDFSNAGSIPLQEHCFYGMYYECSGITEASILPWTTASNYCYAYMYSRCTALTSVGSLGLTKGYYSCCYYMFSYCTSLKTVDANLIKVNTFAASAGYEFYAMFRGCSELTTTVDLSSIPSLTTYIFGYMFSGTKIVTPPYLPWATLKDGCYKYMFQNCTEMDKYATCSSSDPDEKRYLPATVMYSYCYQGMYSGCTKLKNPWKYYVGGEAGHPYHTGSTSYYKKVLDYTSAIYCFAEMFAYTGITTIPLFEIYNTTSSVDDRNQENPQYMFYGTFRGCTKLTNINNFVKYGYDSTDKNFCYFRQVSKYMFYYVFEGCTSLNTLLPLDTGYVTRIEAYGLAYAYQNCTGFNPRTRCTEFYNTTYVDDYGCSYMFNGCSKLTRPYYWFGNNTQSVTIKSYACYQMYTNTNIIFNEVGGLFMINNTTVGTNGLYCMFGNFKKMSNPGNVPNSAGTVSTGTRYYFADSPIRLELYHTQNVNVGYQGNYIDWWYSVDRGQNWYKATNGGLYSFSSSTSNYIDFYCRGNDKTMSILQANTPTTDYVGQLSGSIGGLALDYVYGLASTNKRLFDAKFLNSSGITSAYYLEVFTNGVTSNGFTAYYNGGNTPISCIGYPQLFRGCEYLITAPYNMGYNYGYNNKSSYYFDYASYGIYGATFSGCIRMKNGPGYWDATSRSIAEGHYLVGYKMFNDAFYNCNNLTSISSIVYSNPDTNPILLDYRSKYIFSYAFYNCYALTKNVIPHLTFDSNGGDMPDGCLSRCFYGCKVLEKHTKIAPKTSGNSVYARESALNCTYCRAKINSNAIIYIPKAYGASCMNQTYYDMVIPSGSSYINISSVTAYGNSYGTYDHEMYAMYANTMFGCYTAWLILKAMTIVNAKASYAMTSLFESINGTSSGSPISATMTLNFTSQDYVRYMFRFSRYGTWSPLDAYGTPTRSGTFTFSY